ncbi:hypothetical protein BTA51_03525 [Hahella sp. CCB-MM4]|uniref:2'-5' RNA ligase family protein n=1 Tax=Hahella sp. (strain CCB-MM4) TaxID=1926491 RepID=UPI000B9A9E3E|nr:2'-5' RNA ligase family protein [Hahella sp. CCB-MM4]OZG75455.1 hypothetical protein BTA51_03525 [Hahella sp. CCB-MM4]
MSLVVLAYPELSHTDNEWIEEFRLQHDELHADVVSAHFTMVFPVSGIEKSAFIDHVQRNLAGIESISFVLRCATLMKDAFSDYNHVFLVPDEGYSHIVKLHDRFYTGLLAEALRLDIPYIPHIGIANSTDAQKCKSLADAVNAKDFAINGTIGEVEVVEYIDRTIHPIQRFVL